MAMMLMMFLLVGGSDGSGGGVAEVFFWASGASQMRTDMAMMLMMFLLVGGSDGSGGGVAEVPGFITLLLLGFGRLSDENRHGHDAHDVPACWRFRRFRGWCGGGPRVHHTPSFGLRAPLR